MSAKTDLNALLNKKMDRKDFLRNIALGLVVITGVTTVLRAFAPTPSRREETMSAPQGYGASAYGGSKTSL